MMGLRELQRRRTELVERSGRLRSEISAAAGAIAVRVAVADRVIAVARGHPLLTTLGVVALAMFVSRGTLGWLRRGLTIYALLRSI
jgi:hypothetical protein